MSSSGGISPGEIRFGARMVSLRRFRNFEELDLELSEGFNVLAGPNAQGKTNFLEALHWVSTTRLLRGMRDAEAIQDGADAAEVLVELLSSNTQLGMRLVRGARKRATLNGVGLPRAADLLGRMPCVSLTTLDLPIVRNDPAERRMFLDVELSQLYPAYLRHLSLYKRALEQRNALVRASRERFVSPSEFEPWESPMAEHGAALRTMRSAFLERLVPHAEEVHASMGGGEGLRLAYTPRDEATGASELADALGATRAADQARGGTSVGPHRDDFAIAIEDREARLFGSQGQQRTAVIALKMATLEVAREELGAPPLLLLDDMLSDLDETRRAMLVERTLECAGQAVLTCTEASSAGPEILEKARVFNVRAGTIGPA
ncbi:MAG: DNA replication and repair protein RecF [Fimbriimonadaceae bacterium]|nr:DNA replication and repair protein RecF [Fimbriimonadaceae bacterium]